MNNSKMSRIHRCMIGHSKYSRNWINPTIVSNALKDRRKGRDRMRQRSGL